MRLLLASLVALAPAAALAEQAPEKPAAKVTLYKTASSAACSGEDVAVWVDPDARLYYLKGDKLFGKTRHGGYNCRKQVEAAGYRAAKPQ
jgi:hypothetical protein